MSADPCGCDLTAKIPHRCERHQEEIDTQSQRTFYLTSMSLEWVTVERPVASQAIEWIQKALSFLTVGSLVLKIAYTQEMDAITTVKILRQHGQDPDRFGITSEGKDIWDGE